MLYPQENIARELRMLDGFWDFQIDPEEIGEANGWTTGLPDAEPMTVPASFNELVAKPELRDYLGSVWYLRRFFVPASWAGRRIWLRFGSVHYRATVWLNGREFLEHEGGHLPFAGEATAFLRPGRRTSSPFESTTCWIGRRFPRDIWLRWRTAISRRCSTSSTSLTTRGSTARSGSIPPPRRTWQI